MRGTGCGEHCKHEKYFDLHDDAMNVGDDKVGFRWKDQVYDSKSLSFNEIWTARWPGEGSRGEQYIYHLTQRSSSVANLSALDFAAIFIGLAGLVSFRKAELDRAR